MTQLTCFKAYDVRGKVPSELNADIAFNIGRALVDELNAKHIVVGHDIRLTGPELSDALMQGIKQQGCDVTFIGTCGTEEIYFAAQSGSFDAGVCVTASHNPQDYNGMKFVSAGAKPLDSIQLNAIRSKVETTDFNAVNKTGNTYSADFKPAYKAHLLSYIQLNKLKPLKLVVNAGNGGAGAIVDLLEDALPFEIIKINHQADGTFPNGVPNPLLPENRLSTAQAVVEHQADLGIAWDGDFDRCFVFDETGNFVEGYYIVGLLAAAMLEKSPGETVVFDPRLCWNTQQIIADHQGKGQVSKTGHAFIKATMREVNAIYGGEMSAHHYFRDFAYCDNGNIPWLLICQLLSEKGVALSELVHRQQQAYPCSGEINFTVADSASVIAKLKNTFAEQAVSVEEIDGLSLSFTNWRFNIRASNTEPLLRLNVESKGDFELMQQKTQLLSDLIKA
ncbi:hypothetical protein [Catenovulum agarivorans]|uniref:hypothetical protein n=1 Tax=Catenovulum agarivorans TaxID=1172192 RepID=UPI0002F5270E|nr:hypothetical protein [Catenovulum agarivorans]